MAQLPRTQPEATQLTRHMIEGFTQHPETFPSANVPDLQAALDNFMTAAASYQSATAAAKQAGQRQKRAFAALQSEISQQIKVAEVDTVAQPVKLGLIGYSERRKPTAVTRPGPVVLKTPIPIGQDNVQLSWQKNSHTGCGPVQTYLVERRTMGSGQPSPWSLCATAFDSPVVLNEQPQGVKLEYRVIAANRGGQSLPSNTVSVTL